MSAWNGNGQREIDLGLLAALDAAGSRRAGCVFELAATGIRKNPA
jgi:hypothetical protein